MTNELIETIVSEDDNLRHRSINFLLKGNSKDGLLKLTAELEAFRKSADNLYHRVRASLFLFVIYRFYLQENNELPIFGEIPFKGTKATYDRDFEESINVYLTEVKRKGCFNSGTCSALANSYFKLAFKYLLDQVKHSISHSKGNSHLFNTKTLNEYPYSAPAELTTPDPETGIYPVGLDTSPVRIDPSHSGWSDIFFLGMDFPEGARVVNISVNLRVKGQRGPILPPCECYCQFIKESVIELVSVDLKASKKISTLEELFNLGNDYLPLLKAGVIASGIIPPCFENKKIELKDILSKLLNKPGGIKIVSKVNGIPKGSRLAVSTTLMATIISRLMRFSGQIKNQTGAMKDEDRRIVASRAILGEWLGGSGGGWQDSGGLWPGIKVITGKSARAEDPEFNISRGCLLPDYHLLSGNEISKDIEDKIINSIVLVHGGISQNVGPILEMVTEKYLLRYDKEWRARLRGKCLFDKILHALKIGDMKELGRLTTQDWEEAIQPIIPWVNNAFTENLIRTVKEEFKEDYWGFLMLGGMSGGGMAFIVSPEIKETFEIRIVDIMRELKKTYKSSFPFIIDPVVYDFEFNHQGITAHLLTCENAKIPGISSNKSASNETYGNSDEDIEEEKIKDRYGFDSTSHEHLKALLKKGEIGLDKNRLPLITNLRNIEDNEIIHFENVKNDSKYYKLGIEALRNNEIAVVSFAGGLGSRWTDGAAVVKAINPFIKIKKKHRTFIEIHIAKSRETGTLSGHRIPHVFTTSYLTHDAIANFLDRFNYFDYKNHIYLSPAKSIGRRVYPLEKDLKFYWETHLHQKADKNMQKVLDEAHKVLINWTKKRGQGEDYSENKHLLRFNPPGHWYEIPNLLKNGTLAKILRSNPQLKYLFCHNIDTVGAFIEPSLLGIHIASQSCLNFEVIPKKIEDKGGGLAIINGKIVLIEGLALPREEDEFRLTYYNTLSNWITIDSLLEFFKLDRELILRSENKMGNNNKILKAIQNIEKRMPTYVTIKNVKYLWGNGQEDVYPVAQFEKLWGDMSSLNELKVSYVAVSRFRGQQLKKPSQLYSWMADGSFNYIKDKISFHNN